MRERGHESLLALRELRNLAQLDGSADFGILQAPVWLAQVNGLPEPPLNYSEILLRCGYHDAASLTVMLRAWCKLLEMLHPRAVVLEHAPTAALAARVLGIPALAVGGTFNIPPRQSPLPGMRPWLSVPQERLAASDRMVLGAVNGALANLGAAPLDAMSELFDNAECLLCAFPELDHYPARRGGQYFGPLFMEQFGESASWPAGDGRRIFAYLPPASRGFKELLETLSAMPHRVIAVAPGISAELANRYSRGNMLLTAKPCRLDEIAESCDLAITSGNNGTVNSLLLRGIPQLMFAEHLEHYLFARRVVEAGAGEVVDPERPLPPLAQLVNRLLEQESYRNKAREFAARHAASRAEDRVKAVADRIEAAMKERI